MTQLDLIPQFDGAVYEAELDLDRLTWQLDRIKKLMSDGQWRTVERISKIVKAPECSVSAQLRNLKKPRFGGYKVEKRRAVGALWEYRVSQG